MSNKQLTMYAERIGIGVCSMPNSYATELAIQMMDAAYIFNEAYTVLRVTPVKERKFELYNNVQKTRSELCELLNRIAWHYMLTEKDYIKVMTDAGFEITITPKSPSRNRDVPKGDFGRSPFRGRWVKEKVITE